jgi:hypothetical protein
MIGLESFLGEIEMDASIRERLTELKDECQRSSYSEVPEWLRELIVENISRLLDDDASNRKVADKLAGGLRAIMDGSSPGDDDPIVRQMVTLIDDAYSATR